MRRRRQRNRMIQLVLLIILVIAAIAGIVIWKRYSPSKEQYDMKKYYGIEKDGQLGITVDNKVVEAKGKLSDGKAYVAYDVIRDYINSRFYWDSNENVLLYIRHSFHKFLQRILICNLIPLVHIITTFITVYFFFPPDQSTLSSVYFSGIMATFSH